ncbi:TraR/DksA family transcriptional regulator [Ramlibacter sp. XY19]|uniref:TraR/DksA family transcriptional regulator n=1 Tax=Ramlibacter paludis TaxID=2908000 RepID=UPI0023D9A1C8|nr:TraR/DksA family transcriptional regulator [Ramlibacter paludis]MCG2593558.1 TraR/DksA family transcriptional regulator [Ramlibacter paludis]
MSPPEPDLLARLRGLLALRQQELRALLQDAAEARASDHGTEVQDFKDVAAEESRAAIDDVALSHATTELAQVSAALRRMDEGSYGACQECGEQIDERRLLALPATPFCTACQADHERPGRGRRL